MRFSRRDLLAGTALALLGGLPGRTAVIRDHLPWEPNAGNPPVPAKPGPWLFFTGAEGRAVEAMADRIIPPDPQTPGGKDSGCAVFIDRQLAGPYGRQEGLYEARPSCKGTKQQGPQSGPARRSNIARAWPALDTYCRANYAGKAIRGARRRATRTVFSGDRERQASSSRASTARRSSSTLSRTCRRDSSPIRSTAATATWSRWKMIGYPGARYDYRDWVDRHNERYPFRRSASRAARTGRPKSR